MSSFRFWEPKKKNGIIFGRENGWHKVNGDTIKYVFFILIKKNEESIMV